MGLIAKLKFKLRKRLAQGTAESVALGILGLVSLERVCKQAPRGIDRGRNQSFFAMNAPQGTPFAAAGALHMPFPSQLHQQPFTGQQFGPRHDSQQSRTSAAEYASKRATATMHLLLHLIDQACLPRALVALESQLVRLCEICTCRTCTLVRAATPTQPGL
ncbi:hypothetical protein NOF04DRAFT_1347055 [Fusarium oxysporum II5]|nr:hypothetical protein NOF04DRAFT_1347055 [Fusarium oxysporum II5]